MFLNYLQEHTKDYYLIQGIKPVGFVEPFSQQVVYNARINKSIV